VASKIGSHIKASNIASSDLFLSVRVPATAAIDDLQRLILSAPAAPHEPGLLRPFCCGSLGGPQDGCRRRVTTERGLGAELDRDSSG
jgi:hypothetical protein